MTALVWHLLSSGGVVLVLLVGAIWIWRRPGSVIARRWLLAAAAVYAALSCYAISYAGGRVLIAGLQPFTPAEAPAGPTAIVVLGSGSFTARDWDGARLPVLDQSSADRVLEAIRVFKMTDAAWVIASGGLAASDLDEPSGRTIADALLRSGVPAARLLVETESRNTHDEAVIVRDMLQPLAVQHVILVTSEVHMKRSLGTFRAQGIHAVPAIARRTPPSLSWIEWVIPTAAGLDHAHDIWHEVLGLGYYFARGWYR